MTQKFHNLLFVKKFDMQKMFYDNVKVAVRVRPITPAEKRSSLGESVVSLNRRYNLVQLRAPLRFLGRRSGNIVRTFRFNSVFSATARQDEIYIRMARPIVRSVMKGYNGTVFTYGQTGSGKTFTMTGGCRNEISKGIVDYSFADIFDRIAKAPSNTKYDISVSYLEIYKERVIDLLEPNKECLGILEDGRHDVYVRNLSSYSVKSLQEVDYYLKLGNAHRTVSSTTMNERSSRSHTIFTIKIELHKTDLNSGHTRLRVGKLHLVDLAGSERLGKSPESGVNQREAITINRSLSTLGNVISALVHSGCGYVPYRDSKLTRLLQDSLGGNSKTVMLATISPTEKHYEETLSTLRYAHRAMRIQNAVHLNEDQCSDEQRVTADSRNDGLCSCGETSCDRSLAFSNSAGWTESGFPVKNTDKGSDYTSNQDGGDFVSPSLDKKMRTVDHLFSKLYNRLETVDELIKKIVSFEHSYLGGAHRQKRSHFLTNTCDNCER